MLSFTTCNCEDNVANFVYLSVDGIDVDACGISSADVPQSVGSVWYIPKTPFAPGKHEAKLMATTVGKGREISYTWTFEVE